MQRLSGKSDAMQLLHRYIGSVEKGLAASFDNRSIIRRHIVDLAVLAATTRSSIGESGASAVVATRLAAALDYIASHFTDPELSLAKVAQSLSISPRYLQRLLESSGTSFTAHDCRLAFPIFRTSTGFSVRALAIRRKASAHMPVRAARRTVFSEGTHPSALQSEIDDAARAKGSTGQCAPRRSRARLRE